MSDTEMAPSSLDVSFGLYERAVLRDYFLNSLIHGAGNGSVRVFDDLLSWFDENAASLELKLPSLGAAASEFRQGAASGHRKIRLTQQEVDRNRKRLPRPSAFQIRLDWVCRTLKLSRSEAYCLCLICRTTQLGPFRSLVGIFRDCWQEQDDISLELVSKLAAFSRGTARKILGRRGQLTQLGLVVASGDDFAPSEMLMALLRTDSTAPDALETSLLGECPPPRLGMDDFEHMRSARNDVVDIVRGALDRSVRGVGILLHGAPGTGKTEFARLLGQACDARVVFVGEASTDNREPMRADRLAHLSLLSAIGERAGRVILVVDEADDIFEGVDEGDRGRRIGSKVFINRVVENSPIPTIWISNRHQSFGEAIVRRMLRAVEFRLPGPEIRQRIVDRHAADHGLALADGERHALSALCITPAVLASSMKAADLGGGAGRMALAAARSIEAAMGRRSPLRPAGELPIFDVGLASADFDLTELEGHVVRAETRALSFLFTGPSGTGKSAYARHLAQRLGMEVLQKRASDLLGKYVGQTEQRIAEAFREAEEDGKFLIFDEADSLLLDRALARRSWEVSQINEMLTQMECHPLPFAATSNLVERLDPATQRRFLFKVRFSTMSRSQVAQALKMLFGLSSSARVEKLSGLTPGDFSVIARKARLLGISDEDGICDLLEEELSHRSCVRAKIGFV